MKKYLREKKFSLAQWHRLNSYIGLLFGARYGAQITKTKHIDYQIINKINTNWEIDADKFTEFKIDPNQSVNKPLSTAMTQIGAFVILPDWPEAIENYCKLYHQNTVSMAACIVFGSILRHILRNDLTREKLDHCTKSCISMIPKYMIGDWNHLTNILCSDISYLRLGKDNVLKTLGCVVWAARKYLNGMSMGEIFLAVKEQTTEPHYFIVVGALLGAFIGYDQLDVNIGKKITARLENSIMKLLWK